MVRRDRERLPERPAGGTAPVECRGVGLTAGKKAFEGDVRAFLQSEIPARCFGLEAVEATTSRGETLTVFRPGTEA